MTEVAGVTGLSTAKQHPYASWSREQLYADAKRKGIKGRSKMTKAELARAVGR